MKNYKIDDIGHTISVKHANRGYDDDYEVQFYEDGKPLFGPEYYDKDCLEWKYDINVDF